MTPAASGTETTTEVGRPRPSRWPFRQVALVLAVTAFAAGIPTPLYPVYEGRFHFGSGTLALIFAAYTLGVVTTLFLLAPQSDLLGRKPVLHIGMALAAASALAFLFAGGVFGLALARVLSGLAVGATTSTSTACLASLEPRHDQHHVARVAVAANFGGVSVGVLLSGLLVEYAPWPTELVFLLLFALSGIGFLLISRTPETVPAWNRSVSPAVQRMRVPHEIGSAFWVSVGGLAACYSLYGLFAALAPSLLRSGLGLSNTAVVGASVATLFGCAALVQLVLGQVRDRDALLLGLPLLLGGLGLFVLALGAGSFPLLAGSAAVLGVGVGCAFMGSVTLIDRIAPERSRGEILSAFYVAGYLALAVPTIGVAELAELAGLRTAGLVFGVALGAITAVLWGLTRRTPTPAGGEGWPRGAREIVPGR
ncbi:MAG: MFS transporter [Thermoplasmata archaeon]|nr:MFS transporter [Thermoplasmata archaeon]